MLLRIFWALAACAVIVFALYWMVVVARSSRSELLSGGVGLQPSSTFSPCLAFQRYFVQGLPRSGPR